MFDLSSIFGFYDNLIGNLSPLNQALISLLLLLFLLWQIYMIIKSGHWIFITALLVFLPGTWPAARHILFLIIAVFKFLVLRAGLIFLN